MSKKHKTKSAKIITLVMALVFLSFSSAKAQVPTITIAPTTLSLGDIELTATTDGTHNFDVVVGAGTATTITVEAYKDDGTYSYSGSYEISIDNKASWGNTKSFTSDPAGETRTVYVRCSPTADNTANTDAEIWAYNSSHDDYIDQASVTIVYPEMDMYGGSSAVAIADGDVTPATSDSTDFGNVNINSTSKVTYTIKNNKGGPPSVHKGRLFLEDIGTSEYITISGTDASMFSVTSQPTSPIAYAGGSTTFMIAFTPTSSGTKTATISIGNNDTDEDPYNFSIQGTGVASKPTLKTSSVSSITSVTSSGGGDVTADGGATVTVRGVCWNTSTDPTTSNSHTTDGSGTGSYSSSLSSLTPETHYYVRAYATNSAGTSYGGNVEFWTLSTEPTTQASSLTITAKAETTIDLSWSAATGATGYLVLKKDGSTAPNSTGVEDGMDYASFSSIPAGTSVESEVTGTTYQVKGLTGSTQYSFAIIPLAKGSDNATYNYKTDGTLATVTGTTVTAAPSTQASGIKYSGATGSGQMEITWTAGNGDGQIVIMKANSDASNPANGTSYTGNTTFGSGDDLGDGSFIVYRGSPSKGGQIFVTNLSDGTDYYFKVFEYSGAGSQTSYNTTETTGWNTGNTASSALPIELTDFSAEVINKNEVALKWQTASELNNNVFIIERSVDAINFEPIGKVKGSGTTNSVSSYNFTDKKSPATVVYYRLKQVDYDGTSTTHTVVSIDMSSSTEGNLLNKLLVLNTNLSLELNLEETGATKISLMDINGKFLQGALSTTPGAQTITFDMSGLSHGVYIVLIQQNDKSVSRKIAY